MSSPDFDLVVVGDCNPDVLVLGPDVTPAFGQQEKLVERMSLEIGGSAAITAVAAARLGLRVALVAAVGPDAAGTFMLDALAKEGVDVSAVAVRDGQRDRHDGGAVPRRGPGHPDRPRRDELADRCRHPGSICSAACAARARELLLPARGLPRSRAGRRVRPRARAAGATTSLDTNWDPAERWRDERLSAAIAQADLLLPNEAEALALSGTSSVSAAALALMAFGPRVAVKLGARGVLVGAGSW